MQKSWHFAELSREPELRGPLVNFRVDRLRAAQSLSGMTWSEIAKALGTKHQNVYHLARRRGRARRRCHQVLRDGLARVLRVPVEWLSGETDALAHVRSADASIVCASESRDALARLSWFRSAEREVPGLQLALSRVLARASIAVARDLRVAKAGGGDAEGLIRLLALLLVAACAETGLDYIQPLPPIKEADDVRIEAVRQAERIFAPWLEGQGSYPEWKLIFQDVSGREPAEGLRELLFMEELNGGRLYAAYDALRARLW
jgi:hypothetical protein